MKKRPECDHLKLVKSGEVEKPSSIGLWTSPILCLTAAVIVYAAFVSYITAAIREGTK